MIRFAVNNKNEWFGTLHASNGSSPIAPGNGVAYTGSGGGGAVGGYYSLYTIGGNGGHGVVIISYPLTFV